MALARSRPVGANRRRRHDIDRTAMNEEARRSPSGSEQDQGSWTLAWVRVAVPVCRGPFPVGYRDLGPEG